MKRFFAAAAAVLVSAAIAWGLSIPLITGPQEVSQMNATFNSLINSLNSLVTPQTMASFNNFRNVLDNGNMSIQQRGTGIVTCGTTTIPSSAYSADRWGCNANVTSGAGRSQVTTATPTPPAGFTASQRLYRTSGALTQPVCMMEEIGTVASTALAGQSVVVSVYEQPLAGLVADNGGVFNVYIFTGTGTDEGLQTFTASPAITPAWTGIATTGSFSFTNTAASWVRQSGSAVIPAAATEIAVAICFTPTATGAGVTDGLAFTGVQLEVSSGAASPYEFKPAGWEQINAFRFFYRITESATVIGQRAMCGVSTTSLAVCQIKFPVPMRAIPVMTYTSGFALTGSAQTGTNVCAVTRTSTTLTSAGATTEIVPIDCTSSAAFGAAGTAAQLYDIGTGSATGVISASADY